MQASRVFMLLVGLVITLLLSGCASTRPDVESQLAAEVVRLNDVDRRLMTELWAEIQATNELLAKVIARLHEVDVQGEEGVRHRRQRCRLCRHPSPRAPWSRLWSSCANARKPSNSGWLP